MKITCTSCGLHLSLLSVLPSPQGIECGGCMIRRVIPDKHLDDVRLVALREPQPVPHIFFWLLETAERN